MNKTVPLRGFGGGGALLNFEVVGGATEPTNPKGNTIWVNTDKEITSWHFGTDEPNVYNIQAVKNDEPWNLNLPDGLTAGKRVNFTIPLTVSSTFEAIRFYHAGTGRMYCVRNWDGTAVNQWPAGMKVCVILSDNINKIGEWSGNGTAYFVGSPYVHEEGTVWIQTGKSGSVAFNALKKNSIMVYPVSAKQWISGAWVDKTAKINQSGAWSGFIDLDTFLYRYDHPNNPAWVALASTTVSTNDDGILIATSTTTSSHCTFGMSEAIDITNVSALRFVYSSETLNYGNRFGVTASKPISGDMNQYSTYVAANTTGSLSTFKEVVLDVSALSGFVYVSGCLVGTFHIKEVQKV